MHALVDKAELDKALTVAAQVVRTNSPLNILKNLLLTTTADGLRISATNLDSSMHVEVPCDCLESGSCTVPAKTLCSLVSKLPGGTVTIDSCEDGRVQFRYGAKGKFDLPSLPPDEFPKMEDYEHNLKIEPKVLAEMISATAFCTAGNESTRAAMKGLRIHASDGYLEFAGTDGLRLIFAAKHSEGCPDVRMVAPKEELQRLAKLLRGEQEPVLAAFSERDVSFRAGPVSFSFRLIEHVFPNIDNVRPKPDAFYRSAVVSLDLFSGAIGRILVVAEEKQQPNLLVLKFSKDDQSVTISANTPDVGMGTDTICLESYDGDDFEIAFNGVFLSDFLRGVHSEFVELSTRENNRSARLRPFPVAEDGLSLEYIVMPVKLQTVEVTV